MLGTRIQSFKSIIHAFFILIVCIGIYIFEYFWSSPGYYFIKFLFAFFFAATSVFLIRYISIESPAAELGTAAAWLERKYHRLIIAGAIIFVYGPLLTEGYYWYDDLWFYAGAHSNYGITISLSMLRPFHGLLGDLFWFVTPSNAYCIKWFSIACLLGYAMMLYTWILRKSGQPFLSLAITLALSLFSPLSDHLGYSATLSILPAMLTAGLSVVLFDGFFENIRENKRGMALSLATAGGCILVFSLMLHQIATPIVFLFLIMYIYFNQKPSSSIRFCISYTFFFGLCVFIYMIFCKFLIAYYGQSSWERTGFIGIQDIPSKIGWFFKTVMPAIFDRLGLSILGRAATFDKCYWRFVQYHPAYLKTAVSLIFTASIIITCLSFLFRRKKLVELFAIVFFIPMSYFLFLVLKEDGYLTYYALPLLSVVLFFFVVAVKEVVSLCEKNRQTDSRPGVAVKASLTLLICILAFQNNVYLRQFWVETNKEGYNYLKNTLSLQIAKKNKVHVFGVLTPGQGNVYSVFATKLALKEIGYNPDDFTITTSDDEKKISVIQADILEGIKKLLTPEELQYILSNYIHDSVYHRYICNTSSFKQLTPILTKAGLLPGDYAETAVVDLRWIKPSWPHQSNASKRIKHANKSTTSSGEIIGNLDVIKYSGDTDTLTIGGWAAIEDLDSSESQISIVLRSADTSFELTGEMLESPDVVAFYDDENYTSCRISFSLCPASSKIKPGTYEIWIYIANKGLKEKASMLWIKPLEIHY